MKKHIGNGLLLAMTFGAGGAFAEGILSDEIKANIEGEVVYYDSSGGLTDRARQTSVFKNFSNEAGVTTRPDFSADMTKFFAAMDAEIDSPWSFITFPTKGDYLRARDAGYLSKIDTSIVDVSKLAPGSYDEYGISAELYGITLTYNTEAFSGDNVPTSMVDLYDLEKFPGKRCLFNYPQFGGVLESALLADGVKPEDIYPLDLDRAFAKLDTIKSSVIWWPNGDEAIRNLSSGECSMGIAWSGRVYNAVKSDNAPLALVWPGSLYAEGAFAVPSSGPNLEAGQALLAAWIGDHEGQKGYVNQITYTTDIAALDADFYGEELKPWIVAGENMDGLIREDADYYYKNLTDVVDRFNRWLALN